MCPHLVSIINNQSVAFACRFINFCYRSSIINGRLVKIRSIKERLKSHTYKQFKSKRLHAINLCKSMHVCHASANSCNALKLKKKKKLPRSKAAQRSAMQNNTQLRLICAPHIKALANDERPFIAK